MAVLIPDTGDETRGPIIRAIHQARSARKSGNPAQAMAILAGLQLTRAPEDLCLWVHSEWLRAARESDFSGDSWLYTAGPAHAAVLAVADRELGRLRAVTAIGLKWEPGKIVSSRSLRSLAPLQVCDRPTGGSP
jgi:hypothetical protein